MTDVYWNAQIFLYALHGRWQTVVAHDLLAVIDICQLSVFCSRKTEMTAIMTNLAYHDVRTWWTLHSYQEAPRKGYRSVEAVNYDSDVASVAHGSTND